jgi:hypothetical protein
VTPLELRPLAIGELLDRVFTLYRRHLFTFVGIMAIPSIFNLAMALVIRTAQYLGGSTFAPRDSTFGSPDMVFYVVSLIVGAIAFLAFYWMAYMLALAATTVVVAEIYAGRDCSISSAFARARQQTGRLMLLALFWFLLITGPVIVFAMVGVGLAVVAGIASGSAPPAAMVAIGVIFVALGLFVLFALCVFLSLRYALSGPALMLEGISARVALRRSVFLTRGYLGRVFLMAVCAAMLAYTGIMIFQVPFTTASALMGKTTATAYWIDMVGAVSGTIGQTLTAPVMVIGVVVLYYDLRVRKEALDLQVMMSALDADDGRRFVTGPPSPALPD